MNLNFAVKAPDQATFWQSWINAGIVEINEDGDRVYLPEYPGIITTTTWPGSIVKTPGVYDDDMVEITPPVMITGWHTNVLVRGPLVLEMTYGLDQYETNEDGEQVLKNIFDRTWATNIFQLTYQEADAETGFPAGYRNNDGVSYADTTSLSSPSNVWA